MGSQLIVQPVAYAYLAGFDVFRQDSIEHGKALKKIAESQGVGGLYPLDNEISFDAPKHAIAAEICFANIDLIKRADAVIANANPFRGDEPDSGTMFEVGYAVALGKPVYLYLSDLRPMIDKVANTNGIDENGYSVEDFDHPINLMMAATARGIFRSYEEAVRAVAADFKLPAQ